MYCISAETTMTVHPNNKPKERCIICGKFAKRQGRGWVCRHGYTERFWYYVSTGSKVTNHVTGEVTYTQT